MLRVAEGHLSDENIGAPGFRGRPIETPPVEPGYHYHSETNMDLMQPVFDALADAFETLGLGLRSIENEWGPGQVECTFAPCAALQAADNVLLFRTATRQICRRLGDFATFMCRPALKGFYSSGWHLHQSLTDASTGANLFTPPKSGEILSPLGQSYLAGLLQYAGLALCLRRRRSMAIAGSGRTRWRPIASHGRTTIAAPWSEYWRAGDPATRLENRIGEPAANPYLFILSQVVAGLAGIETNASLPPPSDEPYAAGRPMLPKSLPEALDALDKEPLFRRALGDTFIDYFVKLKRTEAERYTRRCNRRSRHRKR